MGAPTRVQERTTPMLHLHSAPAIVNHRHNIHPSAQRLGGQLRPSRRFGSCPRRFARRRVSILAFWSSESVRRSQVPGAHRGSFFFFCSQASEIARLRECHGRRRSSCRREGDVRAALQRRASDDATTLRRSSHSIQVAERKRGVDVAVVDEQRRVAQRDVVLRAVSQVKFSAEPSASVPS